MNSGGFRTFGGMRVEIPRRVMKLMMNGLAGGLIISTGHLHISEVV